MVLEFRGIGAGSHQNQGALTSGGERIELVGGANAAYPFVDVYVSDVYIENEGIYTLGENANFTWP